MGRLIRERDGRSFFLLARTLVGRSPTATIILEEHYASSEHASIGWSGTRWEIRDLGSKNGTFVDGKAVRPGQAATLSPGSTIGFGEMSGWTLADASGAGPAATDVASGEVVAGGAEILALPSEATPERTIFRSDVAGRWNMEHDGETAVVVDGQTVEAGGRTFRLALPSDGTGTPTVETSFAIPNVTVRFDVSQNEEDVDVSLSFRTEVVPLERREHHYLLLTLARARREDAELEEAKRGWRTNDELHKMLRMDVAHLNVQIHRARKQLEAVGLEGAASIVEVRRGAKRWGTSRFTIHRT